MKDHGRAGMPSPYPAAIPRRILTVTVVWLLAAIVLVLSPVLVGGAVLIDLISRQKGWPSVRMVAFVGAFLWIETTSELRALWVWVTQPVMKRTWTERNHDGLRWWVGRLYRAAERVIGLRIEVDEPAEIGPGPLLVFGQHVSVVDAIAPAYVLATERGWNVRYVLTRGLRFVPAMDIVAHRIACHFVARGATDNTEGLATLRLMVTGMEEDECGVIFPGGALFTPAVLTRALEKLTERGSRELERAKRYRHVLPPRPGGVQAFFDGSPDAAVVVVGHIGFEPVASLKRLWRVIPLTDPVEVKIWRHERSEVPEDPDARLAWVYERWSEMDDWIEARRLARGGASMAPT